MELFPTLTKLLGRAHITSVLKQANATRAQATREQLQELLGRDHPHLKAALKQFDERAAKEGPQSFLLFSWSAPRGLKAWLSPVPTSALPSGFYPAHATLLHSFGGIVEHCGGENGWWLLNDAPILTGELRSTDSVPSWLRAAYQFQDRRPPIEGSGCYAISREANGNLTIVHAVSGSLFMLAHDHAFKHLQPLEPARGFPVYSIPTTPRFEQWVEEIARQWTEVIER